MIRTRQYGTLSGAAWESVIYYDHDGVEVSSCVHEPGRICFYLHITIFKVWSSVRNHEPDWRSLSSFHLEILDFELGYAEIESANLATATITKYAQTYKRDT